MRISAFVVLAALALAPGCSKKEASATDGAPAKQKAVSIDAAADGANPAQPDAPPPPAPAAPEPDAAPQNPAAPQAETVGGESELSNWSYTLQDFVYRTKRFPKDLAELATSVHKAVPRAPAGYKLAIDKENQRVVLVKGN